MPSSNEAFRSSGLIEATGVGVGVTRGVAVALGVAVARGVAVGVGGGEGCTVGIAAGGAPTWASTTPSTANVASGTSTLPSRTARA